MGHLGSHRSRVLIAMLLAAVALPLPAGGPARADTAPRAEPGSPVAGPPGTPAERPHPAPAPVPGRAHRPVALLEGDPASAGSWSADGAAGAAHAAGRPAAHSRSTEGLVLERRPDGSQHVHLQGRFRSYSVLALASDGTPVLACADDPASALALARAAASRVRTPRVRRPVFGPPED